MKANRIALSALVLTAWLLSVGAASADPIEMKLWPGDVPGEASDEDKPETSKDDGRVLRITYVGQPSLTVYRAPEDKANGCAVVICPGGGYHILAWNLEGTEIAEWLNSIGVTAVLLKYRVPRRDKDQPHVAPLQDAQRAIRLTRENAEAWGIDTERIGVLGFSAGGHLTVMTGTHWDQPAYEKVDDADDWSCRPDFLVPIYAAYLGDKEDPYTLSPLVRVTDKTPPTFMAVTLDDKHRGAHAALLLVELKKAGVPAELHVFTAGGHGYGLRPSDNPVCTWPKRCEEWMRAVGLLERTTSDE